MRENMVPPLILPIHGRGFFTHEQHIYVMVTAKPKPVLPHKPVDWYPGPSGTEYSPVITAVWQLWDRKAMTGDALPVMVAWHVTS